MQAQEPKPKKMTFRENVSLGPLDKFIRFSTTLIRFVPVEIADTCDTDSLLYNTAAHNYQWLLIILAIEH